MILTRKPSQVGIIMYLPTSDPAERARITHEFTRYKELCMDQLWGAYGACEHWAKVRLSSPKLLPRTLSIAYLHPALARPRWCTQPDHLLVIVSGAVPCGSMAAPHGWVGNSAGRVGTPASPPAGSWVWLLEVIGTRDRAVALSATCSSACDTVSPLRQVELSDSPERRAQLTERLRARFPGALAAAAAARAKLDPRNVLGNELVDAVLPRGPPPLFGSLRSLLGL